MATDDSTQPIQTSVYKYYDANNILIYVGITSHGAVRQRQHNSNKEWWKFVVRQDVQHWPTREEARECEAALIRKHKPPFNNIHNTDHAQIRVAYLALSDSGGFKMKAKQILHERQNCLPLFAAILDGHVGTFFTSPHDMQVVDMIRFVRSEGRSPVVVSNWGQRVGRLQTIDRRGPVSRIVISIKREFVGFVCAEPVFLNLRYIKDAKPPHIAVHSVRVRTAMPVKTSEKHEKELPMPTVENGQV